MGCGPAPGRFVLCCSHLHHRSLQTLLPVLEAAGLHEGCGDSKWAVGLFFFILQSPNAVLYILVFLQVHLSSIFIAFIRMRRKLKTRAGASVLPSLLPEKKATQVCLAIFLCCESVSVFHHEPLPFQAPFKHSLITYSPPRGLILELVGSFFPKL